MDFLLSGGKFSKPHAKKVNMLIVNALRRFEDFWGECDEAQVSEMRTIIVHHSLILSPNFLKYRGLKNIG
jgi:hypothetical protein